MDQLSPAERAEVEGYLRSFPELKNDLREIERTLEFVAESGAIAPHPGLKEKILDSIRSDAKPIMDVKPKPSNLLPLVALLGLGLLALAYLFFNKQKETAQLQRDITMLRDTCENNTNELARQLENIRQLTAPSNRIIAFTPTAFDSTTALYLHTNPEARRNFIQVSNLPDIADNQQYQLWSIKTGQPPSPLNVFDAPPDGLIEVTYVDGTEVYAITIEPAGGRDTPTMEHLIGTVSVVGI